MRRLAKEVCRTSIINRGETMIKQEILDFLNTKGILLRNNIEQTNTFDVLDSMGFLELLSYLEQKHDAEIDLSEFDVEEFSCFAGLIGLIESMVKETK